MILNNGADGLEKSMYILGGAGALARGYNCLIFNGPGQGDSLWVRKLYFRPDWEKVITPVVDAMLRHREVDPKRIALVGVSQGGYWVPRALAFEHRIAAGVADPGVWDVSDPWLQQPAQIRARRAGRREEGAVRSDGPDGHRIQCAGQSDAALSHASVRHDVLLRCVSLRAAIQPGGGRRRSIKCPMLITDPEGEQFFPGQARKLYDALQCQKQIVHFTREQGADQHCEVAAPGYRDYCIYNWLDETLAV